MISECSYSSLGGSDDLTFHSGFVTVWVLIFNHVVVLKHVIAGACGIGDFFLTCQH